MARMCRVACVEITQDAHLWRFADEPKFDIVHLTIIGYKIPGQSLLISNNKRMWASSKLTFDNVLLRARGMTSQGIQKARFHAIWPELEVDAPRRLQ